MLLSSVDSNSNCTSKQFIFKKQKGEKGSSLDKGTNTLSLFCYNETNFRTYEELKTISKLLISKHYLIIRTRSF